MSIEISYTQARDNLAMAFQLAEVGLVGLMVIIVATAFNGVTNEHALGRAFQEALPFTALLVTFFAIVAIIHDQGLFAPVIEFVLAQDGPWQATLLFVRMWAIAHILHLLIADRGALDTPWNLTAVALALAVLLRPASGRIFVGLLVGTVVLVGALSFVPALALGPIVEHLQMTGGEP